MNIERAEQLYSFLQSLPPYAIDMNTVLSQYSCGTTGCWAGWATVCFGREFPFRGSVKDRDDLQRHVCRVLGISKMIFESMFFGTWAGATKCKHERMGTVTERLRSITKDQLLEEWRARIAYAKQERLIHEMHCKAHQQDVGVEMGV